MNLAGFEHRMIPIRDLTMHAVVGGGGPPLVLIHGFPQTWWEWRRVMPELASRHTVIAIDLRGAGHSDKPQGGYDKASLAGDIHGVMVALGYQTYAICGHDIGAMVALALAFTHRDVVSQLIVLDASQPGWSRWEANIQEQNLWHFGFHQKRDLPEHLIGGRELHYVSSFIYDRAVDLGAHSNEDVELFARCLAQPGNLRGALEWYRAFPLDHENALEWKRQKLSVPVLALGGQLYGSRIVSMLREFAVDVSGGTIDRCGHWLPEERPSEIVAHLRRFLGS